ncbi:hypothetical protein HKD37_20G055955 [Glycine soja]
MGQPGPLGPSRMFLQKAVASGGSNLARLGEQGGKHLLPFPINRGRREEQKCSTLLFFRGFPQINVGGDSARIPFLEHAPASHASPSRRRVSDLLDYSEPSSRVFLFDNILLLEVLSSQGQEPMDHQSKGVRARQAFRKAYGKIWDLAMVEVSTEAIASLAQYYDQPLRKPYLFSGFYPSLARISKIVQILAQELDHRKQVKNGVIGIPRKYLEAKARILAGKGEWAPFIDILALLIFGGVLFLNVDELVDLAAIDAFLAYHNHKESPVVAMLADLYDTFDRRCEKSITRIVCCTPALYVWLVSHLFRQEVRHASLLESHRSCPEKGGANWDQLLASKEGASKEGRTGVLISCGGFPNVPLMGTRGCISYNPVLAIRQLGYPMKGAPLEDELTPVISREEVEAPEEDEEVQALRAELEQAQTVKERIKSAALKIRMQNTKLRDVNVATTKALERETKRACREEHGRNKFRGALWGPLGPSRIFLQKAVASGGSNPARLGKLGGKHLPYFAINRGGSEEEKEFRKGFNRSSTFFIRSSSFFDLQRVSDLLDYSEPSSRAFLFENLLLLVVPTATICSSKGMIPLETIKRDMTTLGIIAKSLVISMGTNQTGKRFYQVKVKSLDTTSIKELGRLMEPLQMQAFRKIYGKILELTIAEVSIEAIASLTQYYDQPLRCFMFGDFQLVPTIEEFEEILGCPLGGRKPYLSSGCLPSLSRIATVVKDSARGLDRIKQTRNGIAGLPRRYLEDKARGMANQGDWVPFMDVLALLIFGVVLFPNVDGLVDLAAIDAFLAYHHSKESPVVAILADLFDTFDRRCEKSSARIVCCLLALCVWLVSHLFQQDTRHPCPLLSHRSCTEKRRIDWDRLLAGIEGRTINWFPRWKEGKEGVLFSCGGYPNIPLIGTRGCINYNPALAIRQLGYPMRGAPTEEGMSPFLVRDFGAQNSKAIQRIHKAWETPLRKDQELRGIRNGIIGGYHEWLKVHIRGLDWLAKLKVISEESFEAPEEDEEELVACSRSKRNLSQRLCETETNMLAIIAKYQEELGLATAHEHRIADEYAQVYAEKEARGRYAQHHPSFSAHTGNASSSAPVQPKAPTQREAPQVPTPNTTRPAGNSNTTRNFPPRPFQEFTPLPMTYEDLLPSLIANHLVVVTPGRVLQPPFPKWYDPNATCKYHGGVPGHSVEKCLALKYKVQHLMDAGWLTFQEDRPNVRTNPLANHGGGAINAIESDRPRESKPLRDVATPRRFIFEALQKGGVIPHSGCKEDSCLLHSGELHDMETCLGVEELLQQMIDQGRLEVGNEGKEEQHICMQSTVGSSVAKPKPLVIYFTKSTASQKPGHPLAAKPVPFPYQRSHAVPWRYTPPREKEEEATDVSSLSAKVTNITGLSGVTRSGQAAEESLETAFQSFEVVSISSVDSFSGQPCLSDAAVMMARVMLGNGYEPEMGLGKDNGCITSLINAKGNRGKYGLGYKPTQADMKRSIAGRKSGGQSSRWRQESEGSPPCHISRSFISAGLGDKGQVVAICEDDVPSTLDLVRPCPPDFQLGNWRVEERPGIYATSIISDDESPEECLVQVNVRKEEMAPRKLASKRSRKDKAAEGTSSAPEYDSHRFRSALRDNEYTDFQEEIGRRQWTSLVTPMAMFDPEIVLEFYANAWPTEEGVRDMRSWVRGQWIPFDADAIGQLLGYPLVLEEGQECEYGQRRNRSDGFDEEAIAQLLCIPGQDFARTAAGRRVRIMRTNMTTLTQIWMTLLLSNILPSDHNSDLPLPKCQLVYAILTWMSMAPTRHPLDPDKSNRALGFPALITGLCQSFGVPVAPTKVIRPPITRAFIEKYCTQRQAQGDAPQAAGAPPPPHQASQVGSFDMEQYLRHLVRQQAANHRAHVQTHDCLYQMSLSMQSQGFASFSCPTPDQFRAEVAWPGDWPEAQAGEAPPEVPGDGEEAYEDEEMADLLDFLGGTCLHFSGENTETFSSLTSYPELRRSEFLIGGYVGARASLLSTAPLFVTMTRELVARGDTLRLSAPHIVVSDGTQRQNLVILHPLSPRGGGPDDMRRQNLVIPHPFAIQTESGGEPDDMRRQNLVILHPFAIQTQSCPMARRDKIWSFCTLCHPEAAGPMTCGDKIWSFRTPLPFRHSRVRWHAETKFGHSAPLSSRGSGPDDMRRQNLVIPHPFAIQTQSCPMAHRDKIWSFCTLLSSRGGGPDDTRRQNLVIPHPFAIQTQSCPMARRDKIWSFCTLCHPEAAGPMTCGDLHHLPRSQDLNSELKLRRKERDQSRVDSLILKDELKACSRSKRSLSQRLCEIETNMLAIITKYQEELNLAATHEHRVADEYAQVIKEIMEVSAAYRTRARARVMSEVEELPLPALLLRYATERQAVDGIPMPNTLKGPQFRPQPQPLHFAVGRAPPAMAEKGNSSSAPNNREEDYHNDSRHITSYTPSSFADLVFADERIEVKRGKFNHPAWTNEKTRANEEDEKEGETHAVTAIPIRPTKKPVEFTPIPVSYADLLPYLLDTAMAAITPARFPQPPFSEDTTRTQLRIYQISQQRLHASASLNIIDFLHLNDGPLGTSTLIFRGLLALTFRGLHVLTFRGLHVLAFRGLHALTFIGLHVLAFRGLDFLAFRGLHVLTFRGLHRTTRPHLQHALAFTGLHVLVIRGLHALTFIGLHALAFRGLHILHFIGLHVLVVRGLHTLAFRGLHALAFSGLHIHTLREFKGPVVSFYQLWGHPLILEEAIYASTTREGGYHSTTTHTGARFHPCRCKKDECGSCSPT